jgi:hypothetical protein
VQNTRKRSASTATVLRGYFWIEFGQYYSADALIDQLVHVTELSGGVETAASISETGTN